MSSAPIITTPEGLEAIALPAPTDRLERSLEGGLAWLGVDVRPADCIITLPPNAQAELRELAVNLEQSQGSFFEQSLDGIDLPQMDKIMQEAQRRLREGPGLVVLDRLPDDLLEPLERAKALYWHISQKLGQAVAQKWDGTRLYNVTDTGARYGYGVRGSWTNVELVFHTDNAFGLAPPDRVGLLCFHPAIEGGESRFCSLYSLHNRLLRRHPDALARLYQPFYWDRQAEHEPGAPKVAYGPVFRFDGKQLSARANVQLIRKGYQVAGIDPDPETRITLEVLERVAWEPDLWFELPIERGQMQFLNNREIAHYRGEFRDHDDPALKRHLLRSWHRDWGGPSYDGENQQAAS